MYCNRPYEIFAMSSPQFVSKKKYSVTLDFDVYEDFNPYEINWNKLFQIEGQEHLDVNIKNTTGYGVWANDNEHIFYTKKNSKTLRAESVFRQSINRGKVSDKLIYTETDSRFSTFVSKSKSDSYIFIGSFSTLTSEYLFLDASKPFGDFKLVQKRIEGLEYSVSHFENNFYIYSNADNANNFKIDVVPIS